MVSQNASYEQLACRILGVDVLHLALPRFPLHEGDPIHLPGGLTDEHDRELQYQVCQRTNLSPADWPILDERQRLVWMRLAVDHKEEPSSPLRHSSDFRSVQWHGTTFTFSARQAAVVRLLVENWQQGTPDVGSAMLLQQIDHVDPPEKLCHVFRDHPAWNTMIVKGGSRGSRRIADEPAATQADPSVEI